MRRAAYRFLTAWMLDAPRDDVFDAIHQVERWPEWWRGVESVERLDGGGGDGGDGVGSVYRHRWRSVLPYTVGFDIETTRIERPFLLEGRASGGSSAAAAGGSPRATSRSPRTNGPCTRRGPG